MMKLKVAVIFGGRSGEHEVSLVSGQSVMRALDPQKYEVIPVGITRDGAWIVGDNPARALEEEDYSEARAAAIFADPSRQGLWASVEDTHLVDPTNDAHEGSQAMRKVTGQVGKLAALSEVDVVFPVLHGTFGEDGTVQGLLELAGIPYVGAGVLASALAMDKITFKDVVRSHGLPITDYVWMTRSQWLADPEGWLDRAEQQLGYPIFTKPANLGSSVGICKCRNREELRAGLTEAARYDRRVLAEQAVPHAREIEVSVLGNEEPEASIPGEIVPHREFYDYVAKYVAQGDDASDLLIPAPLDAEMTARVRELAVRTFRAIDGSGMARVDFLMDGETDELYLNEVNTIPGFTPISMYPKLWAASGLDYTALLDALIDLAIERYRENQRSERIFRPAES
ncbi:MAG: D-alanine--D-alanine ligase [Anaerolineae bacterium]|nr:D-alanine--D-alanine ligase [Anaerolineae bacterium]